MTELVPPGALVESWLDRALIHFEAHRAFLRSLPLPYLVAFGVALAVALLVLRWLWKLFFNPYRDDQLLNDAQVAALNNPVRRQFGEIPPPYPNGWFRLLYSVELAAGHTTSVFALGQQFVVFRGQNGIVTVADAYCVHMGANLGKGRVVDNCIECPFHAWRYDQTGKCVSIPYLGEDCQVPEKAAVRVWESREIGGQIIVWHDAERRASLWEPPIVERSPNNNAPLVYHGHTLHHVACHVTEIPENGPDDVHLDYVHPSFMYAWMKPLAHVWKASWKPGTEDQRHLAFIRVVEDTTFLKKIIPGMTLATDIVQIGPGLVQLRFDLPGGRIITVNQSVTPKEPLLQEAGHAVFASPGVPRLLAKFVLHGLNVMFSRDFPIWMHKRYAATPLLVKADGPIMPFRRWFAQFYSEHSVSAARAQQGSLLSW